MLLTSMVIRFCLMVNKISKESFPFRIGTRDSEFREYTNCRFQYQDGE